MWEIFGNQVKNGISATDIKIKRLIIVLTIVFGMGLDGKVFGAGTKSKNQKSLAVTELERSIETLFSTEIESNFNEIKDFINGEIEKKVSRANIKVNFLMKEKETATIKKLGSLAAKLFKERKEFLNQYLIEYIFINTESNIYKYNLNEKETTNDATNIIKINAFDDNAIENYFKGIRFFNGDYNSLNSYEKVIMEKFAYIEKSIIKSKFSDDSFRNIINNVLSEKYLYTFNSDNIEALSFIRRTSDLKYSDYYLGFKKDTIDNLLANIFINSRRLMRATSLYELVLKDYNTNKDLSSIKIIYNEEETEGCTKYFFDIENNKENCSNFRAFFRNKPSGMNAGYVLEIDSKINFYIKEFHAASRNKADSPGSFEKIGTHSFMSSSLNFSASLKNNKDYKTDKFRLNLKEPFIYKLLEVLSMSPRSIMVVNPYINQGFYIATEDLMQNGKEFILIKDIEEEANQNPEYLNSLLKNENLEISLSELDMVSTMFLLRDLHRENYGLINSPNFDQIENNEMVKVIDFIYPKIPDFGDDYTIPNIGVKIFVVKEEDNSRSLIIDGDSLNGKIIKYNKEDKAHRASILELAFKQFQSRIGKARPIEDKEIFGEDIDDFQLREILKQKTSEIKSLMLQLRGTEDKPEEIMLRHPNEFSESITDFYSYFTDPDSGRLLVNQEWLESNMRQLRIRRPRTNAELIGFKSRVIENTPRPGGESPNLEYIEDAFEDLDNYCQGIMCNYKALKKFITEGYNEYFDEQGNPKVESASSAE